MGAARGNAGPRRRGLVAVTDRAALFLDDLEQGPAALTRLLDAWTSTDGGAGRLPRVAGRRVRFTGMGSSRFAALLVASALERAGGAVTVGWASADGERRALPDEVLVAISSSGKTREVVEVARRTASRGGTVVAVTNADGSPLADASTAIIPLLAGDERSGIACRTFRGTVAALALATGAAALDDLVAIGGALDRRLAERGEWIAAAADLLERAEAVDVIGDGGVIGALEQAALMLREAPRLRTAAWDAGDWLHTAVYTALPGHRAILFSGTPYDAELVGTIQGRGGQVVTIGGGHDVAGLRIPGPVGVGGDLAAALDGVAVAELVAAELWSRAAAPGP